MSMSSTSKVGVNGKRVGFYLKLDLVEGIVGGNAEDFGELYFGEEVPAVFYHGDTHGVL